MIVIGCDVVTVGEHSKVKCGTVVEWKLTRSLWTVLLAGPLLSEPYFQFTLTTPSPMPAYLNIHYICESASRLLFLSMHWTRSLPCFQMLS